MSEGEPNRIIHAASLDVLPTLADASFTLVYLDPPSNPARDAPRRAAPSASDPTAVTRLLEQGYERIRADLARYDDRFESYWAFLEPHLLEAWRLLDDDGTLYLHLDSRESAYAKVLIDALVGRESFLNEIVWAHDYGAEAERSWPRRHDTILVYVKSPSGYWFDAEAVDREPYMAPGLVTREKAERGKLPTDVWWHTIVPSGSQEATGYPAQKPEGVLRRILQASTREGDRVLDCFAGSGTTGAVAATLGRRFVLVEADPTAIDVMRARFGEISGVEFEFGAAGPPPSASPASIPSPSTEELPT